MQNGFYLLFLYFIYIIIFKYHNFSGYQFLSENDGHLEILFQAGSIRFYSDKKEFKYSNSGAPVTATAVYPAAASTAASMCQEAAEAMDGVKYLSNKKGEFFQIVDKNFLQVFKS
jgi:hypothetical protein